MAITPIDSGRYACQEMASIWEEESKLAYELQVEAALARAHANVGNLPKATADEISRKATTAHVTLKRVKEIEREIHHDVMAMVVALTEACQGGAGRYVHLGATSNDITDTALAMQLRDSIRLLRRAAVRVRDVLLDHASQKKELACVGRTHGQHALPTTFGLKFALWACEMQRNIERLDETSKRVCVGKMTGAVGTQAGFGPKGLEIQSLVMKDLGIGEPLVTNQVLQRDRHADYVFCLAQVATTLEKIFTEIRNLQRTEINEVAEGFGEKQVGSSSMPSKRNPILSERICGLARVVRAMVEPELLCNLLWHERDLTNSSCERVVLPEATMYVYYMLTLASQILRGLTFNLESIERNLGITRGLIMAERVMNMLVDKGVGRQEAHSMVRRASMKAISQGLSFPEALEADEQISKLLARHEIQAAMDPRTYLGTAREQVERVVKLARESWGYGATEPASAGPSR